MALDTDFRRKTGKKTETGFTLIELLIVIVVLGILAAVVVFALGSVTSKSGKAACSADAKTVETAIAAQDAQSGSYPAAGTDTNASGGYRRDCAYVFEELAVQLVPLLHRRGYERFTGRRRDRYRTGQHHRDAAGGRVDVDQLRHGKQRQRL